MIEQLNTDIKRLRQFVTAFCFPETKDIRTRCVDAAWRTDNAIRAGNEPAMRRSLRENAALLAECDLMQLPMEVMS